MHSPHCALLRLKLCCASILTNSSLSGTLPASLGCNQTEKLMVGNNLLSGSSSAEFAAWTDMKTFSIEQNPQLDWALQLLGNWTSLEHASMQVPTAEAHCAD